VGPLIGYNKYNRNSTEDPDESMEGFRVGLNFIAGVEWLFNEDMCLSAEYGIEFSYINHNDKIYYNSYNKSYESKYYVVQAKTINFGISVYF